LTLEEKRAVVEPKHPEISVRRQCELLDLSRSSLYYRCEADLSYNEQLMRLLDEQYLQTPFYGVPRMTAWLRRQGHTVNEKRVRRLLRAMGLEAIYPRQKQGLSQADRQHQVYPYLLRGLEITRPNQVWAADITYIRMARGWVYLMAILDWFSRYVVAWELSITLEADFCVTTLQRALSLGRPEIFNTDQGSQFTSDGWIDPLKDAQVAISMDGRGRVFDNIFIERLWRSVKVEEVYLHDYQTVREVRDGLGWYFPFYNEERPHQALGDCTPAEVYTGVERRGGSLAPLRCARGSAPLAPAAYSPAMGPPKKSPILV
jgi:putative transposase